VRYEKSSVVSDMDDVDVDVDDRGVVVSVYHLLDHVSIRVLRMRDMHSLS